MKVKKYTAPTMPEAMEKVRKELGKKAVILNSKEAKTKGFLGLFRKKYIEIIAAVDPNPVESQRRHSFNKVREVNEYRTVVKPSNEQPQLEEKLINEIKALKAELSTTKAAQQFLPETVQLVENKLREQQINDKTISELTPLLIEQYYSNQSSEKDLINFVKNYFFEQLKDKQMIDDQQAKHIYLVGPTGVGKTTTIAKLAAKSAITDGKRIAFITLDTYRIAAIEQLKTYAKILNIPIEVAYNKEDFKKAKDKFKDYDHIFIDTAGRNYRKEQYINQFKQMIDLTEDDEVYCVLSLTSKEADLQDILNRFEDIPINRVIFTKADETTQYGYIYNLWKKFQFNFSYITFGQNVPDDIQRLTPELTVNLLVGEEKW
ncbi:flagellar biosynthesis protein FlhF [Bacillaceae bacterium W0354]